VTSAGGREYPTRPIVGVGAVLLVRPVDRERFGCDGPLPECGVVLVKRRFEPLAGQWSLPGGTLEVGETLAAGVAREVVEETGIAVEVGPVVDVLDRIMLDGDRRVRFHFVLVDYLCRPIGGRLQRGSDAAEAVIADVGALERYQLADQALRVIARAVTMARTDI
jgi:8-oxo-dGTP diphosphatase